MFLPADVGSQEGTSLSPRSSHRCVAVGERLIFLGGTLQDKTCNQSESSSLQTLRLSVTEDAVKAIWSIEDHPNGGSRPPGAQRSSSSRSILTTSSPLSEDVSSEC